LLWDPTLFAVRNYSKNFARARIVFVTANRSLAFNFEPNCGLLVRGKFQLLGEFLGISLR
jgi:hypothetical protein